MSSFQLFTDNNFEISANMIKGIPISDAIIPDNATLQYDSTNNVWVYGTQASSNSTAFGTGDHGGVRLFGNPSYDTGITGKSVSFTATGTNPTTFSVTNSGGIEINTYNSHFIVTSQDQASITSKDLNLIGSIQSSIESGNNKVTCTAQNNVEIIADKFDLNSSSTYSSTTVGQMVFNSGSYSNITTGQSVLQSQSYSNTTTGVMNFNSGDSEMKFETNGELSLKSGSHTFKIPTLNGSVGSVLSFNGVDTTTWVPQSPATNQSILSNNGSGQLSWLSTGDLSGLKGVKVLTTPGSGTVNFSEFNSQPKWIKIQVTGGGGSGGTGEDNAGQSDFGSGGSAGGTIICWLFNIPVTTTSFTYVVGSGGSSVSGSFLNGTNGNSSYVTITGEYGAVTITGGPGSGGYNGHDLVNGPNGGTGSITNNQYSSIILRGGGAGPTNCSGYAGGQGGSNIYGGETGGTSADNGSTDTAFNGCGSGGGVSSSGAGGNGVILITYG